MASLRNHQTAGIHRKNQANMQNMQENSMQTRNMHENMQNIMMTKICRIWKIDIWSLRICKFGTYPFKICRICQIICRECKEIMICRICQCKVTWISEYASGMENMQTWRNLFNMKRNMPVQNMHWHNNMQNMQFQYGMSRCRIGTTPFNLKF